MITKLRLAIDPSEIGFRRFLKYQIGAARFRISHIESNEYSTIDLDEYADAVKIKDLHDEFTNGLTDGEKEVVDYLEYHTPIEKEPKMM